MEREGEREEDQSVSSTSEEKESAQNGGDTSPDESGGSGSGMEAEPEVVAEKVKYLCGEDEDTLPDRFGDRKSQVRFGTTRPSFAIVASSFIRLSSAREEIAQKIC